MKLVCNDMGFAGGSSKEDFANEEVLIHGKPMQLAFIAWFNLTVRIRWLREHLFANIEHAQLAVADWL